MVASEEITLLRPYLAALAQLRSGYFSSLNSFQERIGMSPTDLCPSCTILYQSRLYLPIQFDPTTSTGPLWMSPTGFLYPADSSFAQTFWFPSPPPTRPPTDHPALPLPPMKLTSFGSVTAPPTDSCSSALLCWWSGRARKEASGNQQQRQHQICHLGKKFIEVWMLLRLVITAKWFSYLINK